MVHAILVPGHQRLDEVGERLGLVGQVPRTLLGRPARLRPVGDHARLDADHAGGHYAVLVEGIECAGEAVEATVAGGGLAVQPAHEELARLYPQTVPQLGLVRAHAEAGGAHEGPVALRGLRQRAEPHRAPAGGLTATHQRQSGAEVPLGERR